MFSILADIRRLSVAVKKALSFQTLLENGYLYSPTGSRLIVIIELANISFWRCACNNLLN